jgi:hypothetical protein
MDLQPGTASALVSTKQSARPTLPVASRLNAPSRTSTAQPATTIPHAMQGDGMPAASHHASRAEHPQHAKRKMSEMGEVGDNGPTAAAAGAATAGLCGGEEVQGSDQQQQQQQQQQEEQQGSRMRHSADSSDEGAGLNRWVAATVLGLAVTQELHCH